MPDLQMPFVPRPLSSSMPIVQINGSGTMSISGFEDSWLKQTTVFESRVVEQNIEEDDELYADDSLHDLPLVLFSKPEEKINAEPKKAMENIEAGFELINLSDSAHVSEETKAPSNTPRCLMQ